MSRRAAPCGVSVSLSIGFLVLYSQLALRRFSALRALILYCTVYAARAGRKEEGPYLGTLRVAAAASRSADNGAISGRIRERSAVCELLREHVFRSVPCILLCCVVLCPVAHSFVLSTLHYSINTVHCSREDTRTVRGMRLCLSDEQSARCAEQSAGEQRHRIRRVSEARLGCFTYRAAGGSGAKARRTQT